MMVGFFKEVIYSTKCLPLLFSQLGYIDYAGSGVVHLCGAVCAFMGAWLMGPRAGRFRDNQMVSMPGHSVPLAALGGLILVFGFLAQNVGKHGSLSQPGDGEVIAIAVTNTILATAMGGTSVLVFNKLLVDHQYSFLMVMNGSLTATVAVCAGCDRSVNFNSQIFMDTLSISITQISYLGSSSTRIDSRSRVYWSREDVTEDEH